MAGPDRIAVPEVDPDKHDRVVTVMTRRAVVKSDKGPRWRSLSGGSRGVTITADVHDPGCELVVVVEGASDVAASHAAGIAACSRPGKRAGVGKFVGALRDVSLDAKIVLLIENDEPGKSWTGTVEEFDTSIDEAASDKAQELANELLRPIHVFRPPRDAGDLVDWWRILTDANGHRMSDEERHAIGGEMRRAMMVTGKEVVPSPEVMQQYRDDAVETLIENSLATAEENRQDAIERGHGIDADFDRADSCTFFKSFHRRTKKKDGTDFLFSHLSCKSWKCPQCRRRKMKPDWLAHIAGCFGDCELIYRKEVTAINQVVLKAKLAKIKKKTSRDGGHYVAIQQSDFVAVVYSTVKPRYSCSEYRIGSFGGHVDELLSILTVDIQQIEIFGGKPISTSRDWSRGEEATSDDAEFKIERIAETAQEASQMLWVTLMTAEDAVQIWGPYRKRTRVLIVNAERNLSRFGIRPTKPSS